MKKIFLILIVLLMVGCSKKVDIVCTEKNDIFISKVELYFKNNELVNAISISEYNEKTLANQVCLALGDKVKCYENKIEILNYTDNFVNKNKNDVINDLKSQGFTCK